MAEDAVRPLLGEKRELRIMMGGGERGRCLNDTHDQSAVSPPPPAPAARISAFPALGPTHREKA